MMKLLFVSLVVFARTCSVSADENIVRTFPNGFIWGIGSSSYQIEGGWNADGKGPSIWDVKTHLHPEIIKDGSNADITADSYHQWRHDVQILRELRVGVYRFSISWPRILPQGDLHSVNVAGINYYSNLIDELLSYNITPMVTIFHWELPQTLQDRGGWSNPDIIPTFSDYARLLFALFGDRVKIWTTINEPWFACNDGYGINFYLCSHHMLKAHAEVVHIYREHFLKRQSGMISMTLDISWPEPNSSSADDQAASERALQFYLGMFAHPIFSSDGNYPKIMIEHIGNLSLEQGYSQSRLPAFTTAEVERIRGTADFFSINSYTSVLVTNNDASNSANFTVPSFEHDRGTVERQDESWPGSGSSWLKAFPKGMYNLLMWIKKEYNDPNIIVTENGVSDRGGLEDHIRVDYLYGYLDAVLDAIEDGANVQGYIAWSLMDNFEWTAGYTEKFGFYHVDFDVPERTRTAKLSALVYSHICKTNTIDLNYRPELPDARGNSAVTLIDGTFILILVWLAARYIML